MDIKLILEKYKKFLNGNSEVERADLTGAELRDADLTNANLTGADLTNADLTGADLTNADLRGADLTNTDLIGADLRGADLRGADLRGANLTGADLRNANLRGADLTDKFYYIGNIGSRNSQTTVNLTKNIVWCGCFTGTMEEFEEKVKKTHINNNYYYDYMDFIELCKKKMDRIKNGGIK